MGTSIHPSLMVKYCKVERTDYINEKQYYKGAYPRVEEPYVIN